MDPIHVPMVRVDDDRTRWPVDPELRRTVAVKPPVVRPVFPIDFDPDEPGEVPPGKVLVDETMLDAVDEILKTDSLMIESHRGTFWKNLKALKLARHAPTNKVTE